MLPRWTSAAATSRTATPSPTCASPGPPREGRPRSHRVSGDLQSVYVLPQHRDGGVGEALVAAVLALADEAATEHVTVSSSSRAVSLYQRCGFAVSPRLLKRSAQD